MGSIWLQYLIQSNCTSKCLGYEMEGPLLQHGSLDCPLLGCGCFAHHSLAVLDCWKVTFQYLLFDCKHLLLALGIWGGDFVLFFFRRDEVDRERNCENDSMLPFLDVDFLLMNSSNSEQNLGSFVGVTKKCDGSECTLWFSSSASSLVLLWRIFRPFLWWTAT